MMLLVKAGSGRYSGFFRLFRPFLPLRGMRIIGISGLFITALIPLASARAEGGGFEAAVVPSVDTFFHERWRFTITESMPRVSRTDRVVRGQTFIPYVLMKGYRRSDDGRIDLSYDIRVVKPDGAALLVRQNVPAVQSRIERDDLVLLSANNLHLAFQPRDAAGRYAVEITVRDAIGQTVASDRSFIELADEMSGTAPIDDLKDLGNWMQSYYEDPHPEQINSVFFKFVKLSEPQDDAGFITPITFFVELYKANRHLLPELAALYPDEGGKNRFYILHVLYLTGAITPEFEQSLDTGGKGVLEKLRGTRWPDPYDGIEQPFELDMLWSGFFATGSFRPIAVLVRQLEGVSDRGELEKFQQHPKRDEIDGAPAMRDVHYRAAKWSIGANAAHHRLVREYCRFLLAHGKLSAAAKQELSEALQPPKSELQSTDIQ